MLEIVEQVATDVLILHDGRVAAHGSVAVLRDLTKLGVPGAGIPPYPARDQRRRRRRQSARGDEGVNVLRPERLLARMFFGPTVRERADAARAPAGAARHLERGDAGRAGLHFLVRAAEQVRGTSGAVAPAAVADAILDDQLLFVTYSMMAVGLVALIVWEGVFPDRRDVGSSACCR